MNESRTFGALDQLSRMIAGTEQVTRWRVNARDASSASSRRSNPLPAPREEEPFAGSSQEAVYWRVARRMVLGLVVFCFAMTALGALDPGLPPSGNFDLSHWKLTLPDTVSTELEPGQLTAGFSNAAYFYTSPDGAMTFWSPVTGGVTSGSPYPRCELREMMDPENETMNWSGHGTNILEAQCKVTKLPSSRIVIIGQIHSFTGNAYPLVKLLFDDGQVEAQVRDSPNTTQDTTLGFGNFGLSNLISYQLSFTAGVLSITVNGSNRLVDVFQADRAWTSQSFYFKAGSYCQDNSGATNEGARVSFYKLSVEHSGPLIATPVITLTNLTVNAAGHVSFVALLPGDGNYFIQGSPDRVHWSYLLITNVTSGRIDFTDSLAPGARFYRAGVFSTVTMVNSAVDALGRFGFTLVGPGSGNYFIQSSPDLLNWNYLLITNSVSGWVEFRETDQTTGDLQRFYRCGSF